MLSIESLSSVRCNRRRQRDVICLLSESVSVLALLPEQNVTLLHSLGILRGPNTRGLTSRTKYLTVSSDRKLKGGMIDAEDWAQ
jgi:hypothetical protein